MRRTARLATALATTVVLLGACGSVSDSSSAPAAPRVTAAPAGDVPAATAPTAASGAPVAPGPSAADALPNTLVHNVADDQFVTMSDFVVPGMPVLVWFWAPH